MNIVLVRGVLSSEPREKQLPSGSRLVSWEVTTDNDGQKLSVPVVWFDPPAGAFKVGAGDEVVVAGAVRRRYYQSSGRLVSSTEVVATRWARAGRATAVAKVCGSVIEALQPAD
jgi:single-strand DNA-binding protein